MYQSSILADPSQRVSAASILFTPLEQTVVALARGERGRGLRPTSRLGRILERLAQRWIGRQSIRPLADPRLEALRTFVNTLHHCRLARNDAASTALRAAGFSPMQEHWLRSGEPACAQA